MRHPIRTLTILGGFAATAALSGCNAEESTSTPPPASVPTTKPAPSIAPTVSDMKPADTKPADTKPADTKPADT